VSPNEQADATLKKVTSIGYEKNGPTVSGTGSTLSMKSSTVTGEGPTPYIAQNGVQVAFGAKGIIKSSEITGNECDVASCSAAGEKATGVLFYEAAAGSSIASSHVNDNDMGIYYSEGGASASVAMSKDRPEVRPDREHARGAGAGQRKQEHRSRPLGSPAAERHSKYGRGVVLATPSRKFRLALTIVS
jgi:hypothetical protein